MGRNRNRPARTDPNKPPRPRNAWMLFLCAYHSERTRKQELNLPVENETHQHTKIISQMWKALSDEERDKWIQAAEHEKEEHARLYPGYRYQPSKTPGRKQSTASASPPPAIPPPSSSAHPSVTKGRSNSTASNPKAEVLGSTPVQWDVPQAAKKAKIRQETEQIRQAHIQHQPAPVPQYAPAPQQYAQHYAPATAPAPVTKARRGRPPKAKQEVIEEDLDNLELVDGQLVPKASGSGSTHVVESEDEESEDEMQYDSEEEAPAASASVYQYNRPGYAYAHDNAMAEDSESEDEASSQMSPPTPTQAEDGYAAPSESSKPAATDATFTLRPATFQ